MLTVIAALIATARTVDRERKKPPKQPSQAVLDELNKKQLGGLEVYTWTPTPKPKHKSA
jgi:hypothetical protein